MSMDWEGSRLDSLDSTDCHHAAFLHTCRSQIVGPIQTMLEAGALRRLSAFSLPLPIRKKAAVAIPGLRAQTCSDLTTE